MVLGYYPDPRFDSAAAGFKEYTIVGVKVIFTPHRFVTTNAGAAQKAYQSSYVSDHTVITGLNIVGISDDVVLGQAKPKSHLPEEKLVRYLKFGYYAESQFAKRYLKTTGGGAATRQTWIGDE